MGWLHPGKSKSRIHHDARSIPLKGSARETDSDEGRYFKCWNCGFICNKDRDALGGPESASGKGTEFYYLYYPQSTQSDTSPGTLQFLSEEGLESEGTTALATIGRLRGMSRVMELGPDGAERDIFLTYMPKINSGCPGCGTLNWRGDYR